MLEIDFPILRRKSPRRNRGYSSVVERRQNFVDWAKTLSSQIQTKYEIPIPSYGIAVVEQAVPLVQALPDECGRVRDTHAVREPFVIAGGIDSPFTKR